MCRGILPSHRTRTSSVLSSFENLSPPRAQPPRGAEFSFQRSLHPKPGPLMAADSPQTVGRRRLHPPDTDPQQARAQGTAPGLHIGLQRGYSDFPPVQMGNETRQQHEELAFPASLLCLHSPCSKTLCCSSLKSQKCWQGKMLGTEMRPKLG